MFRTLIRAWRHHRLLSAVQKTERRIQKERQKRLRAKEAGIDAKKRYDELRSHLKGLLKEEENA